MVSPSRARSRGLKEDSHLEVNRLIDIFIPYPDVRERHETIVHAPANVVLEVARNFDMLSLPLVRGIFWLRAKFLRATAARRTHPKGLVEDMISIGWGVLADEPGRILVAGAFCQPWHGDVVFQSIPPEQFATFAEPDQVKIVWTLEAAALEDAVTRFATETRVRATDDRARTKFRRYWRIFSPGILMIRRLLLRSVRQQAERQWRAMTSLPIGRPV